jgi:hypothetical protein
MDNPVKVTKTILSNEFLKKVTTVQSSTVLVGIPSDSVANRVSAINARAKKFTSTRKSSAKKKTALEKALASTTLSNAQILRIFSRGSSLNKQPARPVIEPAIKASGNKEKIVGFIAQAAKEKLAGRNYLSTLALRKAGEAARNACKAWFTDSRNNWAENTPETIRRKGSSVPGINTSAMKNAITYVERENS